MNERIRELAIQVQRTEMPGVLFAHPEFVEKFAELIVKECAEYLSTTDYNDVDGEHNCALEIAANDIMEHFGVE